MLLLHLPPPLVSATRAPAVATLGQIFFVSATRAPAVATVATLGQIFFGGRHPRSDLLPWDLLPASTTSPTAPCPDASDLLPPPALTRRPQRVYDVRVAVSERLGFALGVLSMTLAANCNGIETLRGRPTAGAATGVGGAGGAGATIASTTSGARPSDTPGWERLDWLEDDCIFEIATDPVAAAPAIEWVDCGEGCRVIDTPWQPFGLALATFTFDRPHNPQRVAGFVILEEGTMMVAWSLPAFEPLVVFRARQSTPQANYCVVSPMAVDPTGYWAGYTQAGTRIGYGRWEAPRELTWLPSRAPTFGTPTTNGKTLHPGGFPYGRVHLDGGDVETVPGVSRTGSAVAVTDGAFFAAKANAIGAVFGWPDDAPTPTVRYGVPDEFIYGLEGSDRHLAWLRTRIENDKWVDTRLEWGALPTSAQDVVLVADTMPLADVERPLLAVSRTRLVVNEAASSRLRVRDLNAGTDTYVTLAPKVGVRTMLFAGETPMADGEEVWFEDYRSIRRLRLPD